MRCTCLKQAVLTHRLHWNATDIPQL